MIILGALHTMIVQLTRGTSISFPTTLFLLYRRHNARATVFSCVASSVAAGPTYKSSDPHSGCIANSILHEAAPRTRAHRSIPTEEMLPLHAITAGGEASVASGYR